MKIRHLILIAPTGALLLQIGCSTTSGSNGAANNTTCDLKAAPICKALDYTSLDSTPVSFMSDLFEPIIRPTCNTSSCHGTPLAQRTVDYPGAGLYLGPSFNNDTTDDLALRTMIVGELLGNSTTAPSEKIVVPNEPANSFLMLKLTGCQNTANLTCTVQSPEASETDTGCGDTMPAPCFAQMSNLTLSDAQIAIFARWIAQGANAD